MVDKVKVVTKRWQGVGRTVNEDGKKVIDGKFNRLWGKTRKFAVKHKDKEIPDLRLVQGRTSCMGRDKKIPHRVKIHGSKSFEL